MDSLLSHLIGSIAEFFARVYAADDRAEARSCTLGCFAFVILSVLVSYFVISCQGHR